MITLRRMAPRVCFSTALILAVAAVVIGEPGTAQVAPAVTAKGETETIDVYSGRSRLIDTKQTIKRVSVTEPKIADVQVLSPRQLLLQGKEIGTTDLILWGEDDVARHIRVQVMVDLQYLKEELAKLFPDSKLTISQTRSIVAISGQLSRAEQVAQLESFMTSHGIKYVNMVSLGGVQQVQLKVRVAEVSRTSLRALGMNALLGGSDFFGGSTIGSSSGGPLNPLSIGVKEGSVSSGIPFVFTSDAAVSPSVTIFGGFPEADLEFFVQALAENQYLRILAEPTLVAMSGQEADFLAGGEYPIPVVQGGLNGGGTSITIEYRRYGVQLQFRPMVLGDGTIRLSVTPEVSELSEQGAVEIQGFSIPSLIVRQAHTTFELKNRQTFAMAGLIQHRTIARTSRVPGLGDIPILGALFRSVRYQEGDTELVVMVTASLVEPLSDKQTPAVPGDLHVRPNDWQVYGLGRIEGDAPSPLSPADAQWLKDTGLSNLKGPGSWARYAQNSPRTKASPAAAKAQ